MPIVQIYQSGDILANCSCVSILSGITTVLY